MRRFSLPCVYTTIRKYTDCTAYGLYITAHHFLPHFPFIFSILLFPFEALAVTLLLLGCEVTWACINI